MIAYISSLTNGGCGFVFKVPVHVLKIPMLIQWNLDITTLYNEVSQNRIGLSLIFSIGSIGLINQTQSKTDVRLGLITESNQMIGV